MDGSRDASFGLRRVEIGIVGDLVVSRVAATMALPKGLLWKHKARRKIEGRGRERAREIGREREKKVEGQKETATGRERWSEEEGRSGREERLLAKRH